MRCIFKGNKIPQHNFLRMRSKAGGPVSVRFYGMLKIRWRISDTDTQNPHSFIHSSYSLTDVSAGRIARELWWTSRKFSPAGIITMTLYAHISPEGRTMCPLVAAVLRRLTPLTWSVNQLIKIIPSRTPRVLSSTYFPIHKWVILPFDPV
jgi:hypothetical protein